MPGQLRPLALQLLQLVGPAEDASPLHGGAAGHGAAGIEHLPVQGDDFELVAKLPGRRNGVVQVLHHRHPAQQIGKDILIAPVKGDQPVRHPHKAGLTGQGLPLPQGVGPNCRNGQNGGPAALPAL